MRPFNARTCSNLRAATAMAAILLALGCVSTPPEPAEQAEADAATAARLYAALEADRLHLYIGLQVRVRNGVAYISALTFDGMVRDSATEIAREVPGVTRVVNQIEVSAGSR